MFVIVDFTQSSFGDCWFWHVLSSGNSTVSNPHLGLDVPGPRRVRSCVWPWDCLWGMSQGKKHWIWNGWKGWNGILGTKCNCCAIVATYFEKPSFWYLLGKIIPTSLKRFAWATTNRNQLPDVLGIWPTAGDCRNSCHSGSWHVPRSWWPHCPSISDDNMFRSSWFVSHCSGTCTITGHLFVAHVPCLKISICFHMCLRYSLGIPVIPIFWQPNPTLHRYDGGLLGFGLEDGAGEPREPWESSKALGCDSDGTTGFGSSCWKMHLATGIHQSSHSLTLTSPLNHPNLLCLVKAV